MQGGFFLPASKVNGAGIDHAIVADGSILNHCRIDSTIVGLRSRIELGSHLSRTILMGADYFESPEMLRQTEAAGRPRIGIGKHTRMDHALYYVRDGILIIPKDAVIPNGTVI